MVRDDESKLFLALEDDVKTTVLLKLASACTAHVNDGSWFLSGMFS
jgi:hypothetical protein